MRSPLRVVVLAALAACLNMVPAPAGAQATSAAPPAKSPEAERREYFQAHYTKYEHRIAMRDGVRLFTAVYVPKEASQSYPILLLRTPYTVSPYGADNYSQAPANLEKFAKEGFVFAYQDVRGRVKSEGTFVNARPYIPLKRGPADVDESSDAYDTIDWLVKNVPGNNGRVGISFCPSASRGTTPVGSRHSRRCASTVARPTATTSS
jgi:predicted acyl esterase